MHYSPKKILEDNEKYGFHFKKNYGQNFIADENTINNIINKSSINRETLVIEIGPGIGSLTYKLGQKAKHVIAYEIDDTVKDILESNLKELNNISIIYQDFLKSNIKDDIDKIDYDKIYVVANLPYYITTPIIMKIIEEKINVDKIIIMVQKEVGNRFKATINSKDYSSISIFLNYYYDIKKIMDVSRNIFIPRPNVDSIVLEFTKKDKNYTVKNETLFFKLVKDSFKQKRKTIKNNLKDYDLKIVEDILKKYNLSLDARAEQISIDIFINIANNL